MLSSVLAPSLVLFGLGTGVFLWVWFTTGKYAKPRHEEKKD